MQLTVHHSAEQSPAVHDQTYKPKHDSFCAQLKPETANVQARHATVPVVVLGSSRKQVWPSDSNYDTERVNKHAHRAQDNNCLTKNINQSKSKDTLSEDQSVHGRDQVPMKGVQPWQNPANTQTNSLGDRAHQAGAHKWHPSVNSGGTNSDFVALHTTRQRTSGLLRTDTMPLTGKGSSHNGSTGRTYTSTYTAQVGGGGAATGRYAGSQMPAQYPLMVNPHGGLAYNAAGPSSGRLIDFRQMFTQIARINDHLFLSSLNAITPDRLRQLGITLIVSAMIDPPPPVFRTVTNDVMHISVEDVEGANLRPHFDRVADRIAVEAKRGGRTLVHCIAGISRSCSLVLAYLMRHHRLSLAEAYTLVRSARPYVQPNPGFWRQLAEYEERVRGSRSVRLVSTLPPTSGFASGSLVPNFSLYGGSTGGTGLHRVSAATGGAGLCTRPGQSGLFPRYLADAGSAAFTRCDLHHHQVVPVRGAYSPPIGLATRVHDSADIFCTRPGIGARSSFSRF